MDRLPRVAMSPGRAVCQMHPRGRAGYPRAGVSRSQEKRPATMAARLSGFSIERLPRLLLRLDQDIEIAVRPKREEQAHVRVA